MKKSNKNLNTQGFVMSELLAGSIVILLLFSILFANYLPLSGEFETRMAYSDVTSNYAAFYVRKIYKKVLEDDGSRNLLNQALVSQSFKQVYTYKDPDREIDLLPEKYEADMSDIISKYQIEEIIITKYKTNEIKKGIGGNSDKRYKRNDGELYKYIKYLPNYSRAPYDGKTSEPYRLIIKTGYGYATTQILPDPPTPISCFDLEPSDSGFSIVDYHIESEECGENVVITDTPITQGQGASAKTGIITAITGHDDTANTIPTQTTIGAFQSKGIVTVNLSSKIKTIGDYAFKDNKISKFDLADNAPGVISIGTEAFSKNTLTSVSIPKTIEKLEDGAFKDNPNLRSIDFDFKNVTDEDKTISEIPDNLFALSNPQNLDNSNDLIELFIPANIRVIGSGAFHNIQFSSIDFEDVRDVDAEEAAEGDTEGDDEAMKESQLDVIGNNAFSISGGTRIYPANNYIALSIPDSVRTIGNNAFENVKIGTLEFEVDSVGSSKLQNIGNSAFKVDDPEIYNLDNLTTEKRNELCIDESEDETAPCVYKRSIHIPFTAESIGENAFTNQQLSEIAFERNGHLKKIGNYAFSGNSLESVLLPSGLSVASNGDIGASIFGNSSIGNNTGEIIAEESIRDSGWICNALFGNNCTSSPAGEGNEVMAYTYNGTTKYISYFS